LTNTPTKTVTPTPSNTPTQTLTNTPTLTSRTPYQIEDTIDTSMEVLSRINRIGNSTENDSLYIIIDNIFRKKIKNHEDCILEISEKYELDCFSPE
jgi:predicted ATPase